MQRRHVVAGPLLRSNRVLRLGSAAGRCAVQSSTLRWPNFAVVAHSKFRDTGRGCEKLSDFKLFYPKSQS